jgi:hypothetical protein
MEDVENDLREPEMKKWKQQENNRDNETCIAREAKVLTRPQSLLRKTFRCGLRQQATGTVPARFSTMCQKTGKTSNLTSRFVFHADDVNISLGLGQKQCLPTLQRGLNGIHLAPYTRAALRVYLAHTPCGPVLTAVTMKISVFREFLTSSPPLW